MTDFEYTDENKGGDRLLDQRVRVRTGRGDDQYADRVAHSGTQGDTVNEHLSAPQRRILQLRADGYEGRGLARELHLAPSTITYHERRMMQILGARTVAHAVSIGYRNGLLALPKTNRYSRRVEFGRHTHSARGETDARTGCGILVGFDDPLAHWKPDTDPVTCPKC